MAFLARNLRRQRVVLVATHRSDEPERPWLAPFLAELGRAGAERLELDRLGRTESAGQMAAILGAAPPMELVEGIFARAEGNPFFTEELLAAAHAGPAELPATLHDLLRGRIQAVSEPARQVLGVAAVVGRRARTGCWPPSPASTIRASTRRSGRRSPPMPDGPTAPAPPWPPSSPTTGRPPGTWSAPCRRRSRQASRPSGPTRWARPTAVRAGPGAVGGGAGGGRPDRARSGRPAGAGRRRGHPGLRDAARGRAVAGGPGRDRPGRRPGQGRPAARAARSSPVADARRRRPRRLPGGGPPGPGRAAVGRAGHGPGRLRAGPAPAARARRRTPAAGRGGARQRPPGRGQARGGTGPVLPGLRHGFEEVEAGLAHLRAAQRIVEEQDDVDGLGWPTSQLAWNSADAGRFEEALAADLDGLEASRRLGSSWRFVLAGAAAWWEFRRCWPPAPLGSRSSGP